MNKKEQSDKTNPVDNDAVVQEINTATNTPPQMTELSIEDLAKVAGGVKKTMQTQ